MYKDHYIRYVNLPQVPGSIVDQLPKNVSQYEKKVSHGPYTWSDSFNHELNSWCQQNICSSMYWGFQFMIDDVPKHVDFGTSTKFVYLLEPGGSTVWTRFWTDDGKVIDEYIIEPNRWHILKANTLHSVEGVDKGLVRWSITGKIF